MGVGGGWVLGVGGKPKAGYTIHKETHSSNVFSVGHSHKETHSSNVLSVGHRNSHSQPGRPRRSLAAV